MVFLSFWFLETGKKTLENSHISRRQASRKSKAHVTFICQERSFSANSWLFGFSILFRGCRHSQKRRHGQLDLSQKLGQHHFCSSRDCFQRKDWILPTTGGAREPQSYSLPSCLSASRQAQVPSWPQPSFPIILHSHPHPPTPLFDYTPWDQL